LSAYAQTALLPRGARCGEQSCPILEFTMINKLTPQQQAAQAEFAAFGQADHTAQA
jgi:hypothetical protein